MTTRVLVFGLAGLIAFIVMLACATVAMGKAILFALPLALLFVVPLRRRLRRRRTRNALGFARLRAPRGSGVYRG